MKAVSEHITNPKDVLNRAAKTAVQTFLGAFGVSQLMDLDVTALEHAIMAAAAAGLAIVHNALLQWSSS